MKLYLVLGGMAFMLLVLLGAYQFGYKAGGNATKALLSAQVDKKAGEIEELKEISLKNQEAYLNTLRTQRRLANAKINKLLRSNEEFKAWWNAPVHPCAVDYIFRVSNSACESLDELSGGETKQTRNSGS